MAIDWITVTAQIINFLILVWLLKRFLYQPVLNAMDRREQRISDRLSEAQRREQAAEDEAQDYRQRRQRWEQEREQRLQEAKGEVAQQRQRLLDEARQEIDTLRQQWREELQQEQQHFLEDLKLRSARELMRIAERALTDLADADLERQVIDNFLQRLDRLDEQTRQAFAGGDQVLRIRSAFELDERARERIGAALRQALGEGRDARFERHEQLICGMELTNEGQKLGWNVAEYLRVLEQRVADQLERGLK